MLSKRKCGAVIRPGNITIQRHGHINRTGQLNTSSHRITWGDSIDYNKGYYPSVALNDSGVVIETHQSDTDADLWMHTGSLVMSANQVLWTDGRAYDLGYYTRVAINNKAQAMEVHQSQFELKIYYHIGAVAGAIYRKSTLLALVGNQYISIKSQKLSR